MTNTVQRSKYNVFKNVDAPLARKILSSISDDTLIFFLEDLSPKLQITLIKSYLTKEGLQQVNLSNLPDKVILAMLDNEEDISDDFLESILELLPADRMKARDLILRHPSIPQSIFKKVAVSRDTYKNDRLSNAIVRNPLADKEILSVYADHPNKYVREGVANHPNYTA